MAQEGAEVVGSPAPCMQGCPTGGDMGCEAPCTPPTTPWYYWWSSWHWFDRCHDRGQHYAYLPPLPGWYYFRPYSVSQLRAQQEAAMQWGGDPHNPYAIGTLPAADSASHQPTVAPASVTRASASSNYAITAAYAEPVAQPAAPSIIPWPTVFRDHPFDAERERIEAPYRRSLNGQGAPTAADYQEIIDAAAQMKAILWQTTGTVSEQDSQIAEKFLDQLALEARSQLQTGATLVGSQP
jgi:hypothetical protein